MTIRSWVEKTKVTFFLAFISSIRLSNYILKTMVDKYNLFKEPFDEACKPAAKLPIRDIIHHPKAVIDGI